MTRPRLTYFSSRGLLEPTRLLLALAEADYEFVGVGTYNVENQPEPFKKLVSEKALAFDSLPLWEEGDFKLVQSASIFRYVSRKYGLAGKNEQEASLIDMYFEGVKDLVMAARGDKDSFFAKSLPKWLGHFEHALSKNGTGYLVGESATAADVSLFFVLESWTAQGLDTKEYPLLQAFQQRMAEKPGIKKYVESPERFPLQPTAAFKST